MNSKNLRSYFQFGAIPGLDIIKIKQFIEKTKRGMHVFDKYNNTYILFIAEDGDLKWYDAANKITRVLNSETVISEGIRLSPESNSEMSAFLSQGNPQVIQDTNDRFNQIISNVLAPPPVSIPKTENTDTDPAYTLALHIGRGGQIPNEIKSIRNRKCGDKN